MKQCLSLLRQSFVECKQSFVECKQISAISWSRDAVTRVRDRVFCYKLCRVQLRCVFKMRTFMILCIRNQLDNTINMREGKINNENSTMCEEQSGTFKKDSTTSS
jgi:hypothetical protein